MARPDSCLKPTTADRVARLRHRAASQSHFQHDNLQPARRRPEREGVGDQLERSEGHWRWASELQALEQRSAAGALEISWPSRIRSHQLTRWGRYRAAAQASGAESAMERETVGALAVGAGHLHGRKATSMAEFGQGGLQDAPRAQVQCRGGLRARSDLQKAIGTPFGTQAARSPATLLQRDTARFSWRA